MIELKKILESSDTNVKKFIFEDQFSAAESVLYRYGEYNKRTVMCVSVQSGCPVGCSFCGTGKHFIKNLSVQEIMLQVDTMIEKEEININKVEKLQIMFMSMGEPFTNYIQTDAAIERLHEKYPSAQLLVSTVGINKDTAFLEGFLILSEQIDKVGLQFSIHAANNEDRAKLIPYEHVMTLEEISEYGNEWYNATARKPYCNYIVTKNNNDNFDLLFELFDPNVFNFTFSVICSPNENMKGAYLNNKDKIRDVSNLFLSKGYDVRIFDPAGQDDIGGGCGQLWYFQNKVKELRKSE